MRFIIFINKNGIQHIFYVGTSMSFASLIIRSFPSSLLMGVGFP
uniref:Uncharacterized protein n=1 Tax=Podoviridae sp. ct8Lf7 TaxID=2827723 RepID=A0A8S5S156_9CAUD|nr:MAG TPA: hypothetical protein [Podoviridae sp. ct8Lf7]